MKEEVKKDKTIDLDAIASYLKYKGVSSKDKSVRECLEEVAVSAKEVYEQGYVLYRDGQYEKARHFFYLLTCANPMMTPYWFALGAAYQLEKKYEEALQGFSMVTLLDQTDPLPFFHMAACLREMIRDDDARITLNLALERTEGKPEHKELKKQIVLLQEMWFGCGSGDTEESERKVEEEV